MKKNIDGFECEIIENYDRDGTNCYVSKGRAASSLAYLEDNGGLARDDADDLPVPQSTIDRISRWAEANGC